MTGVQGITLAQLASQPSPLQQAPPVPPAGQWTPVPRWMVFPETRDDFYRITSEPDIMLNEIPLDKPLEEVVAGIERTGLLCSVHGWANMAGTLDTKIRQTFRLQLDRRALHGLLQHYAHAASTQPQGFRVIRYQLAGTPLGLSPELSKLVARGAATVKINAVELALCDNLSATLAAAEPSFARVQSNNKEVEEHKFKEDHLCGSQLLWYLFVLPCCCFFSACTHCYHEGEREAIGKESKDIQVSLRSRYSAVAWPDSIPVSFSNVMT